MGIFNLKNTIKSKARDPISKYSKKMNNCK